MERASAVKLLNLFLSKHCSFLASFPLCSVFSLSENCGPDLCADVKKNGSIVPSVYTDCRVGTASLPVSAALAQLWSQTRLMKLNTLFMNNSNPY